MFCQEPPDARIVGPVKILLRPKLVKYQRDKKMLFEFWRKSIKIFTATDHGYFKRGLTGKVI